MKKLLLHTCCGPCATTAVERLRSEGWEPALFFSNSNIHPKPEYEKRLENVHKLANALKLDVLEDVYDHESWREAVRGLEKEPEGGKRCSRCFAHNLRRTSQKAESLHLDAFTTTLTVSRYKNTAQVFEAGQRFDRFMPMDFKQGAEGREGYARSLELSRELSLYRQKYCGCEFVVNISK